MTRKEKRFTPWRAKGWAWSGAGAPRQSPSLCAPRGAHTTLGEGVTLAGCTCTLAIPPLRLAIMPRTFRVRVGGGRFWTVPSAPGGFTAQTGAPRGPHTTLGEGVTLAGCACTLAIPSLRLAKVHEKCRIRHRKPVTESGANGAAPSAKVKKSLSEPKSI